MQRKQIKNQVVTVVKSQYKLALIVVVGLGLLYGCIYLFTAREHIPADLKATIDSLTNANKALVEKQKQIDSTIKLYETEVQHVDTKISDIKEKTVIVREYYHEQSQAAGSYTPTQVDSFFRARYGY